MAKKAGYLVSVKVSGDKLSLTAEPCGTSDNTVYQITDTDKQILDKTSTITVKDDGVETAEEYTLNRLDGTVTFGSAVARTITIDGFYLPMTTVASAHAAGLDRACTIINVPVFRASYKDKIPGQLSASISLEDFDVTDTYFVDALQAGDPVVVELNSDTGTLINRIWTVLESVALAAAIDSPQNNAVSGQSTDELLNW